MISIQEFLNSQFVEAIQTVAEDQKVKEIIEEFKPYGNLNPAVFVAICCKYLDEGRKLEDLAINPILTCIIQDLRTAKTEVGCASEELMYDLDEKFERRWNYNKELMTKYLDDDKDYLHNAYHKVLDQYKMKHPDRYFSSQYVKEGALDLRSYEHSRNMYLMFEELLFSSEWLDFDLIEAC